MKLKVRITWKTSPSTSRSATEERICLLTKIWNHTVLQAGNTCLFWVSAKIPDARRKNFPSICWLIKAPVQKSSEDWNLRATSVSSATRRIEESIICSRRKKRSKSILKLFQPMSSGTDWGQKIWLKSNVIYLAGLMEKVMETLSKTAKAVLWQGWVGKTSKTI